MINATVIYHREDGVWWAEAPQADGWSAAADTYAELSSLVREGLEFYFETTDLRIDERLEDGAALTSVPTFGGTAKTTLDARRTVKGFGFGSVPSHGFAAAGSL